MKKLILALLLSLLTLPTFALWKMNPHTGKLDYYESGTDQVGTVTNGKWCVGDADAMVQCTEDAPAGSGDVTDVGDCTGGACFDGTSDGGTYISFYDAQGATKFQVGDNTGAITLTLPVATGTLFINNVSATDKLLGRVSAGAGSIEEVTMTDFAQSILDDANEAAFKATVNLEIGTDVQAYDADLTTYAGITPSANVQTMLGSANNAAILSNIGAQATVTEGSLADSVIVSADIKDGTIVAADTAITAGRSLTWSTNDLVADAELYTDFKGMTIETPTDTDNFFAFEAPVALTVTRVTGIVEAATNAVLTWQECDSAGDNCVTIESVTADVDGTISTDIDNASIDAGDIVRLDVGTVTGTVGQAHSTITFTKDD